MEHGDIKQVTKFLIFPLEIDGETKWWEKATYVKRFVHNVHDDYGHWKYLHWGELKPKYKFNETVITGIF